MSSFEGKKPNEEGSPEGRSEACSAEQDERAEKRGWTGVG
jgi:hypothetical protein